MNIPFTILVDSGEQHPFSFGDIRADADRNRVTFDVRTERRYLGAGWGDYSIDNYQGRCHVERKSMEDAHGTILGWGARRRRFTFELMQLEKIECAAVVVECTFDQLVEHAPSHGVKTARENAKILFRQVLAWQQDYRVPWVFMDGRRRAEIATFRILERFFKKQKVAEKVIRTL